MSTMDLYQQYIHISRYSRFNYELGRRETWKETVQRYVDYFDARTGHQFTQLLQGKVKDYILTLKTMPSMRALMTAGEALDRENLAGFNCFSGDTKYLTETGIRTLADTVGTTQRVLAGDGVWRDAEVRSFGVQRLQKVTLRPGARSRTSLRLEVLVTPDHRWVTRRGEVTDLKVGDCIPSNTPKAPEFNAEDFIAGEFKVESIEPVSDAEVFCVTEPVTGLFTLAGGVLTGNCSYLAVNSKRSFSEALYILMCFHPDTLVVTKRGDIAIKDVVAGDQVRSFDEQTNQFKWCAVTSQVKTPSAARPKVSIELDNGQTIQCTADHQWLTSNRSWVEAQYLTVDDDLVAPTQSIYKISHKVTGKSYVGMTNQPLARRLADHVGHAARGADSHLHKAFRKHGVDAFSIELIDVAYTREEAAEKERFWIQELGTYGATGYNSTYGGEGVDGYQWTEEQRQRASENAYERTPEQREAQRKVLAGNQEKINATRQTAEYKEAQRLRNLGEKNPQFGKTRSDEWKAKISSGQTGELNQFFGRKHSEETKAKIRASKAATFAKKHAMLEAA